MNMNDIILNSDLDVLEEYLKTNPNTDVNNIDKGVTPLYCAITGGKFSMNKPTGKGKLKAVKLLLEKGADPNKKCTLQPPIYTAVFEKNFRILSELLLHKGNPNTFCLKKIIKDKKGNMTHCDCLVPIVLAIKQYDYESVELLLKYDTFFSKETIKFAKNKKNKIEKWLNDYDNNGYNRDNLRKVLKYSVALKKIIKLLEDYYKPDYENKVNKFVEDNKKTGNFFNNFFGFRKLSKTNLTKNKTL